MAKKVEEKLKVLVPNDLIFTLSNQHVRFIARKTRDRDYANISSGLTEVQIPMSAKRALEISEWFKLYSEHLSG